MLTLAAHIVGAGYAIALVAGVLYVSFVGGWITSGARETITRWLATVGVVAVLLTSVFHILTGLGLFTREAALAVVLAISGVVWWLTGGAQISIWVERDLTFIRRIVRCFAHSPYRPVAILCAIYAALPVARTLVVPPIGWDTLTYHSVKAAMWVQNGAVAGMEGTGPWAYYPQVLGGGEVFLAWAMLPVWSDVLVPLFDIAAWMAVGLAIVAFGRRLGLREPFASTAAVFVLTVPTVLFVLGSAYIDLYSLATFLIGFALALTADDRHPGVLILAGAVLGISASTKMPMVPVTGVVLFVLAARGLIKGSIRLRTSAVAAAVVYAAALSPWFVRSIERTGAPLSPIGVHMGSLVLGKSSPELDWYTERSTDDLADAPSEPGVLPRVFGSPLSGGEALGFLTAVPLVVALYGGVSLARRTAIGAFAVAVASISCIAIYFSPQFWVVRHLWTSTSSRFLLPVVSLATITSLAWCQSQSRSSRSYRNLLLAFTVWNVTRYVTLSVSPTSVQAVGALAIGAVGAVLLLAAAGRAKPHLRWASALAIGLLTIAGLETVRNRYRDRLFASDFLIDLGGGPQYWATVLPIIDDPSTPRRIAVTSAPYQNLDNWFAYPLLGRQLQNRLVYVSLTRDGRILNFGAFRSNEALAPLADFDSWKTRLGQEHVTDVMSFAPQSLELSWMQDHPEFFSQAAGQSGAWGLFHVRGSDQEKESADHR